MSLAMECDPPKVYSEKTVRARKEHKCCECHQMIAVGEEYLRASGIWDTARTYKVCKPCKLARDLALAKYPPESAEWGPAFGQLHQWIRDRIAEADDG